MTDKQRIEHVHISEERFALLQRKLMRDNQLIFTREDMMMVYWYCSSLAFNNVAVLDFFESAVIRLVCAVRDGEGADIDDEEEMRSFARIANHMTKTMQLFFGKDRLQKMLKDQVWRSRNKDEFIRSMGSFK